MKELAVTPDNLLISSYDLSVIVLWNMLWVGSGIN